MAITKNTGRQWPLVAVLDFDFNDVGALGVYPAIDLPGGARVISGELDVVTVDAGGGTVKATLDGVDLIAATASTPVSNNPLTATGGMTTAPISISVTVASFVLTTGVYRLSVMYFLDGRANETQPAAIV